MNELIIRTKKEIAANPKNVAAILRGFHGVAYSKGRRSVMRIMKGNQRKLVEAAREEGRREVREAFYEALRGESLSPTLKKLLKV